MYTLSLKWRTGICIAILLVIVIAAMSVVAYIELKKALLRNLDNRLCSDIEMIVALIESEDSLQEARKEIKAFLNPKTSLSNTIYRIWFENEKDYFATSHSSQVWFSNLLSEFTKVPSIGQHSLQNTQNEANHYRIIWAKFSDPRQESRVKHPVNIVIAINSGHIIGEMGEFFEVLLAIGGVTILGSLGLTFWLLRWCLKPVANLTSQMDSVSGKNLERLSPHVPDSPSELYPFVQAWDRMLERLAVAMQHQRRFTADASHELRTPLTIAKSTLQAVLSQKRSSKVYESAIEQSLEDLARLQHLIEQCLELAHLDDISGQQDWQTIDLGDLVAEVCEQYLPFAEQTRGILKWRVCSVKVNGSFEQLKRLLANLIDNAIKYGPAGGEVSVSMCALKEFIRVSVLDQGGNIPLEEQQRIFDRFYRIRTTSRRVSAGAGLGLALAQEIAQKHHGSITVHSDHKTGTDFTVNLPLI
jgi:heavy metal sensor kinase